MALKAELLKFYFQIETSYYALCDWFEKHSVPVYSSFVTPLENKKIPSFPVAICSVLILVALIALIALAAGSLSFSPAQSVYVKVVSSGAPVEGASVQLIAASNEEVAMQLTNATGEVSFS
ncbi:MAG: hypothetical protein V1722_00005, partial [Candidatus Micrarchaeota archaeon]